MRHAAGSASQGKLNIEGADRRLVMVYGRLGRGKEPQLVLYQRGVALWPIDRAISEKSADFTGPLDGYPDHRIAAWTRAQDRLTLVV